MPIESRSQSPQPFPWYAAGSAGSIQASQGGLGSPIKTPSTIEAELKKTSTYIETLNQEITSSRTSDQGFLTAWQNFLLEWRSWYGEGGVWFFGEGPSTLWGSTWDQAIDYQRRAEQFRTAFVAAGGRTALPETATPPEPDANPQTSSTIKWVVAGVAIVAVAYVVGPLVRGASKVASR